jgi:AmpD protein
MNTAAGVPDSGEAPGELLVDRSGWVSGVRRSPSPNFDARPAGAVIDLLVIHSISLPPGVFGSGDVERLFTNQLDPRTHPFLSTLAGVRVSSHFLIERSGRITQFVSCLDRAWHAGASSFEGRAGCNDFSLGVELEGTDFSAFEEAQYGALARLVRSLVTQYSLRAVRGHQHIAADRKTDPGPHFDWRRLTDTISVPVALLPQSAR